MTRVACPSRDAIVHVLIDAGEWASGVADARAPERDWKDPVTDACTKLVLDIAEAFDACWADRSSEVNDAIERAAVAARRCGEVHLPRYIDLRVSEGFAYYALGPELYADAVHAWLKEQRRPPVVWCIGVRTIGLTLAATTAAALRAWQVNARVMSLRPRGHPFSRTVAIDDEQASLLTADRDAWWFVVDEGPGISGSSMAAVARWLCELSIPTERIVLMPAHQPDVSRLAPETQAVWKQHAIVAVDYEATWIDSGRLASHWHADTVRDVAGGAWRSISRGSGPAPGVHPQHERRKYLAYRADETSLLKFSGLGRYGQTVANRAAAAADAGWTLHTQGARDGWIELPWRDEPCVSPSDVSRDDLDAIAQYLVFIARTRAVEEGTPFHDIVGMAVTNARDACGDAAARVVEALRPIEPGAPVVVDNRMRPHEWMRVEGRLKKLDGLEHGDDHFFPGPCAIEWDVAGVIEEWALDPAAAAFLIDAVTASLRDHALVSRLAFYRAAYLAFRTAYTSFCAEQLKGTHEESRFRREHAFYESRLEAVLACAC